MLNNYNKMISELYSKPEFYIKEFGNYNDDFSFWIKIMKEFKPTRVLEVGIGNGRLIKLLHNYVEEYEGIDFSKQIIEYCKRNYNYNNVKLYNCDFKSFYHIQEYDLIIFPFNVFNNFYNQKDLDMCFDSLRRISGKETIIIIDTVNMSMKEFLESHDFVKTNDFIVDEKKIEIYESKTIDLANLICIYNKRYTLNNEIIKEEVLPNRVFFHDELINEINSHGFEIIEVFGDYNSEKYKKNSRKQIIVFRRK